MKLIIITTTIGMRSALSLSFIILLLLSVGHVKAFSCFTTTTNKYQQRHVLTGRGLVAVPSSNNLRFQDQGPGPGPGPGQGPSIISSAKTKANNDNRQETRLFSVPKYIAQEIRDLFQTKKVKSSVLLPRQQHQQQQQQDQHDDDGGHDKEDISMNVLLQELADHYDASDAEGKHELLQRVDDQIEELAERMAVLKSLSEHLQMGDDYLLEDQEVSAMKRFLWTTASSLKCGKHVEYLDGKEINGLKTEIISAIQQKQGEQPQHKHDQSMELFNLQEDYYLEQKMKMKQEEESALSNQHYSYDAWLGF